MIRTTWAGWLLLCPLVFAQSAPATRQQVSAGPITVDGCVQGSGSRITLFGEHTAAAFLLRGSEARLASLGGKRVRITGTETPPDRDHPPQDLPHLRVNRIQVLPWSCPPGAVAGEARQSGISRNERGAATPRYSSPGRPTPTVIPPGSGDNVNRNAEGAPSAGSNDPRNLSPSPPPIPAEVQKQMDSHSKKTKRKSADKGETKTSPH